MPRVSEAHLAARRRQILDAARACFARNGFHATSMQDVVAESGLSIGAVYRYFKSKDDLIQAIAEEVVGMLVGQVDHLVDARPLPPLTEVMDGVLRVVETQTGPDGVVRMAIQVWGESLRNHASATCSPASTRGSDRRSSGWPLAPARRASCPSTPTPSRPDRCCSAWCRATSRS